MEFLGSIHRRCRVYATTSPYAPTKERLTRDLKGWSPPVVVDGAATWSLDGGGGRQISLSEKAPRGLARHGAKEATGYLTTREVERPGLLAKAARALGIRWP